MKQEEAKIQDLILEWLSYNKILAWPNKSQGTYDAKIKAYRNTSKWHINGVSDVLGIYKGKPLAIEVKQPKKYPTKSQREFIEKFKKEGGIVFVARSLDDVINNLKEV